MRLYVGVLLFVQQPTNKQTTLYNCMQMLCKNDTTEFTSQAQRNGLNGSCFSFHFLALWNILLLHTQFFCYPNIMNDKFGKF